MAPRTRPMAPPLPPAAPGDLSATDAATGSARRAAVAWTALVGLLLILALRCTMTEVVRETLAARLAVLYPPPNAPEAQPSPGPGVTIGLALLTLACAALAAWTVRLTRSAWLRLALIAAIVALAAASALRAADAFAAVVGVFDVGAALLAGWAVSVLAGNLRRKQLVLCVLLAILAGWCAKSVNQYAYEIPDTLRYYQENKAAVWATHGWQEGDPAIRLFESRMKSREITGFVTFANNQAAGMAAFTLLAVGLLIAAARTVLQKDEPAPQPVLKAGSPPPPPAGSRRASPPPSGEVSLPLLAAIGAAVLALTGLAILLMSESKGAISLFFVLLAVLLLGFALRGWVVRRRRGLLVAAAIVLAVGGAAVVAYGLTHGRLPSRSLMFRWHYWVAAAEIIRQHPLLGIGLNNFGDYYNAFKLPWSPEDVKDPHSIFVRYAAEAGLPVAALVLALIVWQFLRGLTGPKAAEAASSEQRALALPVVAVLGVGFCAVWWVAHLFLADLPQELYFVLVTFVYCGVSYAGFVVAGLLMPEARPSPAAAMRLICLAGLAGAAVMVLYDQINMALVTGPVAMLFWVILGAADAHAEAPAAEAPAALPGKAVGTALLAGAAVLGVLVWRPVVQRTFPLDPAPYEENAAVLQGAGRSAEALEQINRAIALDQRSVSMRLLRVRIRQALGQPVAGDLREVFALARHDAAIRVRYATPESDLPLAERLAELRRALWLDDQFGVGEPHRLPPAERQRAEAVLRELERTTAATTRAASVPAP